MRLDRRWIPLVLTADRWEIEAGVRVPGTFSRATVKLSWSDRWNDSAVRPYAELDVRVWRLRTWARVGGFWRGDEDGDLSSLVSIGATFGTYGLPNLICLAVGHKPYSIGEGDGWTFCDRCHETLTRGGFPDGGGPGGGLPRPISPRAVAEDEEIRRAA